MVSLFEDRDHLGLFPIVGKGAGEDGAIYNVGKRAKYDGEAVFEYTRTYFVWTRRFIRRKRSYYLANLFA